MKLEQLRSNSRLDKVNLEEALEIEVRNFLSILDTEELAELGIR